MKKAVRFSVRNLTVTALFSAAAAILMYLEIPLPFLPPILKFDFSDLPALIVSFAITPWHGAAVCLIKNLLHLFSTSTMGIGELNSFVFGILFVIPAGLIYRYHKSRRGAAVACLAGSVLSGAGAFVYNYLIGYPLYIKVLGFTMPAILGLYQAILPSVDSLGKALLIFNVPFTVGKALIVSLITMLVYKKLSPLLKGKR